MDARITMFVNTIFTEYHNHSILKIHFVTSARPLVEILTVCVYGIDALNNYNVAKKNKSIHRYYIVWCTLTVNTEVGFIFWQWSHRYMYSKANQASQELQSCPSLSL